VAAIDYASAWDDLQALLLQRDGWGTRTVLATMADLRMKHRISEPDVARALRLAGEVASGELAVHPPLRAPTDGPKEDRSEDHHGSQHDRPRQPV
jgi:hypothetical protein